VAIHNRRGSVRRGPLAARRRVTSRQATTHLRRSRETRGTKLAESKEDFRSILETLARIVAPITVATALLYYFGWVRTGAIFSYFGVDQRLLAYTIQDYLLRSAGIAFRPLAAVLLTGAACILLWYLLKRLSTGSRSNPRVRVSLAFLAVALLVYSGVVLFGLARVRTPLLAAIALGVGVILAESVISLSGRQNETSAENAVLGRRLLIVAGLLLALFWATAIYAQQSGERLARAWGNQPTLRPSATVLSEKDLQLAGPGITATRVSVEGEGFQYRYQGLRLLIYSNSRWFLYPERWNLDTQATVVVLRDEPTIRVEMQPQR